MKFAHEYLKTKENKESLDKILEKLNKHFEKSSFNPIMIGSAKVTFTFVPGAHYQKDPQNRNKFTHLEIIETSKKPPQYIMEYIDADEEDEQVDPTKTPYVYVPIEKIAQWIQEEGGFKKIKDSELYSDKYDK